MGTILSRGEVEFTREKKLWVVKAPDKMRKDGVQSAGGGIGLGWEEGQ